MSGIEVAGLVFGGFPILLNCLDYYRRGFEPLEEWWDFRNQFVKFVDDIKHQMMLYDQNLKRLLDPIITDNEEFQDITGNPNHPRWKDGSLAGPLERRLSSELGRFLRIVERMNQVMEDLRKLLQVKDGKISWIGTPQQKPWQWHYKRLQLSFSKGKHKKVKKLDSCNKELEEILGYGEHIIAIADRRRSSKPVSHLDAIRQHARRLHDILRKQWKCIDAAHVHKAHLNLHAGEAPVSLSVLFPVDAGPNCSPRLQEVSIRPGEAPKECSCGLAQQLQSRSCLRCRHNRGHNPVSISDSSLSSLDRNTLSTAQHIIIDQNTLERDKPSLVNRLSKRIQEKALELRSPAGKATKDIELSLVGKRVRFSGMPAVTVTSSIINTNTGSAFNSADGSQIGTVNIPVPISDLCSFLHNTSSSLGIIQDESCGLLEFSKKECGGDTIDTTRLLTLPELLHGHYRQDIDIPRQYRFEMAAYIAAALLQTHSSPWLSATWSKRDVHFLADLETLSLYKSHPFVSHDFASISTEGDDPLNDSSDSSGSRPGLLQSPVVSKNDFKTRQQQEENTRACLFNVGVMILELIFGRNIEDCSFRTDYYGRDNTPNDQTDISTARRWAQKVLPDSGPQIADAVRRCLDCSFGPQPDLSNMRFKEAVYEGVIKPLAAYSKTWEVEVL